MKNTQTTTSSRSKSNRQSGLVTVEFALIGGLFFLILFGIIEFGRLLFTWNTLDEVTRRAARLAAVCPMDQTASVANSAVFNGTILTNLNAANVNIEYLDENFASTTTLEEVRYVRTGIQNYQHQMIVPLLPIDVLTAPPFTTTLPSESLGITDSASWNVQC